MRAPLSHTHILSKAPLTCFRLRVLNTTQSPGPGWPVARERAARPSAARPGRALQVHASPHRRAGTHCVAARARGTQGRCGARSQKIKAARGGSIFAARPEGTACSHWGTARARWRPASAHVQAHTSSSANPARPVDSSSSGDNKQHQSLALHPQTLPCRDLAPGEIWALAFRRRRIFLRRYGSLTHK